MLDATTGTTTWTTISISDLAFVSGTNTLTIGITGGASQTIDLSQLSNTGTDTQTLTFNPATATVIKTTIELTNGGALSLQTSGSLTFTHTGTDTLEIHAPTAGNLEKVEEGANTGYRILGRDPNFHGAIGENALDLSYQDVTSTTTGATGESSTAIGYVTTATGDYSTAMGFRTTASKLGSTAMGYITTASGYASTAMGANTTAETYGQITIGMYNTTLAGSTTVFDANDHLFVIGNGESRTKKSDALVILKNGDTTLNGALTVSGTISTVASGTLHPDYVFERYYEGVSEYNKSYSLPSLSEIEVFVKANKHLPGVQSRSDIKEKGSWNITENVRTNLEKVEELYLHAIAQEKKIDAQSKVIEQLILRLDALEKKE